MKEIRTVTIKQDDLKNNCCKNCDAIFPDNIEDTLDTIRISFTKDELEMLLYAVSAGFIKQESVDVVRSKIHKGIKKFYYSR